MRRRTERGGLPGGRDVQPGHEGRRGGDLRRAPAGRPTGGAPAMPARALGLNAAGTPTSLPFSAETAPRVAALLAEAPARGGFADDWNQLHAGSADWTQATGPVRFYLFSLKALAFIRLRSARISHATAMLARLAELDPADQGGGSVSRSLAAKIR